MDSVILLGLLLLALALISRLGWIWLKYRGDLVVTCPETRQAAGVALDLRHAAWSGLRHAPGLRLETCSRWPERAGCGQECLGQIAASPEDCLVRTMLTRWYAGKQCVICGQPVGEIHWADHKPGLLSPERRTVDWSEVRPEALPLVLETHAPVCWNCHIVQTLCREHPELVVERSRPALR